MHPVVGAMRGVDWVVLAIFAALLCIFWWGTWRLWRHGEYRTRPYPPPQQQERLLRVIPAATTLGTFGFLGLVEIEFLGPSTLAEKIVLGALGLLFFAAGGIAFSVRLFGRPRWAIAPVLREREERGEFQQHRDPKAWRAGMSEGWLDPDSQGWVDRHWREKHADGDS